MEEREGVKTEEWMVCVLYRVGGFLVVVLVVHGVEGNVRMWKCKRMTSRRCGWGVQSEVTGLRGSRIICYIQLSCVFIVLSLYIFFYLCN